MHVLFIGFVWPEPRSSAASQNILSYIKACLDAKWQVSFCSAADSSEQSFDLTSINVNTFTAKLNCSSFNQQLIRLMPDVVIFDRYLSFEQFAWRVKDACPNAALVLDTEDLHFLRHARHLLCKHNKQSTQFMQQEDICHNQHRQFLYNDITRREIACILQADLSIVLSSEEKRLLLTHFHIPEIQLVHIPFILASSNIKGSENIDYSLKDYSAKQDFVFIGNYRHAPNFHAVKTLREQCWLDIYQQLRHEYPSIRCHVYGAYTPAKVKQLEKKSIGFFVHGFAKNQFEVITNARLMLAPIHFGAGVKGKLLDAMVCNTPSITSPIGSEGITARKWPGAIVDNTQQFVEQACHLYRERDKWEEANANGKAVLQHDFDPTSNMKKFQNAIVNCLSNLEQNRSQHLLQQILNERQFQANKYMSQWIVAKNRASE